MTIYIGIMASSGGSGKDTVADMLIDFYTKHGLKARKYALSTGIYEICSWFVGRNNIQRKHLQAVGENIRHIFGDTAWIDATDKVIEREVAEHDLDVVIITDVRKMIEFGHYCFERDYLPLYIQTDIDIAKQRLAQRDSYTDDKSLNSSIEHELNFLEKLPLESSDNKMEGLSETFLKQVAHKTFKNFRVICNNQGLEELRSAVDAYASETIKRRG